MDIDFTYTLNSKGYYFITNSLEKYHKEAIECFDMAIKKIECFDMAIKKRPNFAYPYYNKGFVLSKLEKYDEAIEYLDKAIKVDPDLAYAWNSKGYALNYLGKYGEALKCFDNAINIFDRNMKNGDDSDYSNLAYAWNNKGYALNSLQRYKEAIECFDDSLEKYEYIKKHKKRTSREIKVDLDLAYAWNNKGYALNYLGKYGEALKCFDNAVTIYEEIKKHDGTADIKKSAEDITYLRKGQSEYMLDDYVSALADFRKINEDNSKLIGDKHNNIGLCYYRQHKFQQAEQEYIKATESSSKSTIADAYYNLAILYNSQGRRDKAMRMCEDCLKSDPNFSKAREALYKLKSSSHQSLEWYSWWFSHVKGKKALGILLISSILAPLLIVSLIAYNVYFVLHDLGKLTSFVGHNLSVLVTAVITMMGLSIAVLLLPSLTKIKVGSIVELETVPTTHTKSNST